MKYYEDETLEIVGMLPDTKDTLLVVADATRNFALALLFISLAFKLWSL